jgi:hypothetical protein
VLVAVAPWKARGGENEALVARARRVGRQEGWQRSPLPARRARMQQALALARLTS